MPANVQIVIKAYNDIINVKIIPKKLMDGIKQRFGIGTKNTTTESVNGTDTSENNRFLEAAPSE